LQYRLANNDRNIKTPLKKNKAASDTQKIVDNPKQ
jgi:hypothetical protein